LQQRTLKRDSEIITKEMNEPNLPIAPDNEPLEDADAIKTSLDPAPTEPHDLEAAVPQIPTGNDIFEDTYRNRLKRGVGVNTGGTVVSTTSFLGIPLGMCTATAPVTTTGAGFDCIAETVVAGSFGEMLGVGVAVSPVRWQIFRWEAG
jgi:hypothetical protein